MKNKIVINFIVVLLLALTFGCISKPNEKTNGTDSTLNAKDTTVTPVEAKKSEEPLWVIDTAASSVSFTITNFGKDVNGTLGGLKGTIHWNSDAPEKSSLDAGVSVITINTGVEKRDKDLMFEKFFNQAQFPEIIFHSDKITKTASGYTATGTLRMKGKSLSHEVPFSFEQTGDNGVFKSNFTLNRHDYAIGGDGPVMGDNVNVTLKIAVKKQ